MMLSKNFSREEFKCNCGKCDYDTIDAGLVAALQDVRDKYAASVTVTSGNRCPEYNKEVGGSENSQHTKSRAADIQVKGIEPSEIYQYLEWRYPNQYGLGNYKTFTHIDTRSTKARW